MSWLTTTSAAAKTASVAALSPASQSKMWLSALPGRSSRMTGAPGSSARSASATAGSGSYSTWINSSASRAEYRSWATTNATSWPWKRTLSVARTACASWESVGIQASPSAARSCPVNTASTRGWASAATVSIAVILACGTGLRRIAPYSMPGSWMSSTNMPRPRMKRASSLRGTGPYAPLASALISLPPSRALRWLREAGLRRRDTAGAAFGPAPAASSGPPGFRTMAPATVAAMMLRCPLDRPHDVLVAGAPADLAGQRLPDLPGGRIRVLVEQPAGGQHHARRAEPALEPVAPGEPLWTGSSRPPFSMPSTVSTRRPSAMAASTVHDFTGSSSSQTTQAPQLEVSQPQCEPVRPSWSRRKWISSSRGSTSWVKAVPLTVTVICTSGVSAAGAVPGPAQGAHGELPGQVPLVVGRAPLIGDRPAVLGGDLAGPGEALLSGGRAEQELLGLRRGELARADRGEADPGVGDRVAIQPDRGPGRAHRPVPDPAAHLRVGAAAAGLDRDPDLGEHLAQRHHGLVGPGVELPGRHRPAAVQMARPARRTWPTWRGRPVDDHAGLQRRERRRQILGRVRLAERAADRPPVAHDRVGDHLLRVVQDRAVLARRSRGKQLRMPGQRPDPQLATVHLDIGQLAEPVDVDQRLRLREPQLHHRDQAVPPGQDPRLRAVPGQQPERVLDAGCLLVLDMRRHLHAPLPPIRPHDQSTRANAG